MDLLVVLVAFLVVCIWIWLLSSRDDENVLFKKVSKKFSLYASSISFMLRNKEKKGLGPKYAMDPRKITSPAVATKTIVFLRHGESDWNNVFNKGINLSIFLRLYRALRSEGMLFTAWDSVFIDSPLNTEGIEQAAELSEYLKINGSSTKAETIAEDAVMRVITGNDPSKTSVIVASNLRRAITTGIVALRERIARTQEKMLILSCLQEVSRNVDTYALSEPHTVADLPFSRILPFTKGEAGSFHPLDACDASMYHSAKSKSFNGAKRMLAFNEWAFQRREDVIIVVGHSLWFKYFFQVYLPFDVDHDAKKKKIVNSGIVSFELSEHRKEGADAISQYKIEPTSIRNVYGGFTTK